jgi:glycosyltransferase involved in cell wall biosynthesis
VYSQEAKKKIEALLEVEQPDIVHLNNIAHQISPSILEVFKRHNIPMVMTLHDYKMVCASYLMLIREGVCEACRGRRYYHCFSKKCVKDSYAKSLVNTIEMYVHHTLLHLYDTIDLFISPSFFLKSKLHDMGFNRRIVVVPHFIDATEYEPDFGGDNSLVYFGRLSHEKGIETLLDAVKGLPIHLNIIGEGPAEHYLRRKSEDAGLKSVSFLGYKDGEALKREIRRALIVVLPSRWYENNPRTILEAFALGKPVIGAAIGGIPELIENYKTGFTFAPGNVDDLKAKIVYCMEKRDKVSEMGMNARTYVEQTLNPDVYYGKLMQLYDAVR